MKRMTLVLFAMWTAATPAAAQHEHHHGVPAPATSAAAAPLYPDLGAWTHPVQTKVPEAQKYFDQGLRLCYGFNHDEATRAFREAARLDPECAMAWWGVAYAAGPNINLPMDDAHAKIALEAIGRAQALLTKASRQDREYIEAMAARYSADPARTRGGLDTAYAETMRELSARHADDLDAATLFAESMMDLNPWNQWQADGTPNPGTETIVATLERVLAQSPNHPGANHFYIHAVEASPKPDRALAAAGRLENLVPGAGHLVHMPAHIYIRVGRYADAESVNRRAVAVDEKYIAEQKPDGVYPMMYYNHNIHFIWFAACMEGRSAAAMEAARKVAGNIPAELALQMPMIEFVPPVPVMTMVRFGRWKDVLAEPAPAPAMRYTTGLHHYARGLAQAALGDFAAANTELDSVKAIEAALPADQMVSINYAKPLMGIAVSSLDGQIAARQGRTEDAFRLLEEAVKREDGLHYDEPPTWPIPVRPDLGAALLQAGKAAEAEAVYRADLERHPENGWSLNGLARSLRAQKHPKAATDAERRFRAAWKRADYKIAAAITSK